MIYTIEVRDSDGNDCHVYDLLVEAVSKDAAQDAAWAWVRAEWPKDDEDGGDGTFHPCDCECKHGFGVGVDHETEDDDCDPSMWECSHGGVLVGEVEEGDQSARYHTVIDLGTVAA
jgi:hypothetical protein